MTSSRSAARARWRAAWRSAWLRSSKAASSARLTSFARRPIDRALFLRQPAQPVEGLHQRRAAPQVGHLPALQRLVVLDALQLAQGLPFDLLQLFGHRSSCSAGELLYALPVAASVMLSSRTATVSRLIDKIKSRPTRDGTGSRATTLLDCFQAVHSAPTAERYFHDWLPG